MTLKMLTGTESISTNTHTSVNVFWYYIFSVYIQKTKQNKLSPLYMEMSVSLVPIIVYVLLLGHLPKSTVTRMEVSMKKSLQKDFGETCISTIKRKLIIILTQLTYRVNAKKV